MNISGLFRHFPSTFMDGIVGERVSSMPKCPDVEYKKQAQAEESHQNKCYRDGALLNSHYVLFLLLRELEFLVRNVGVCQKLRVFLIHRPLQDSLVANHRTSP